MAPLTPEQKQRFLELTRRGWNRGAAASEAGTTGTNIRRILNPESFSHDPEFTAEYLKAVAEAEPDGTAPKPAETKHAEPVTVTRLGYTKARYITDDAKEEFLERVAQGEPRDRAAHQVGTSLHQLDKVARSDSDFAARLAEAYEQGRPAYQEWIRAEWRKRIEEGNYAALRDAAIIHLPEAAVLRTTRHEIGGLDGGELKILVEQVIPGLPPAVIEQMINHLERGDTAKALPAAQRVIEAA